MNQVLTDSRTDLRELNDVNFARFDARLEQRAAEIRAELRVMEEKLDGRTSMQTAMIAKRLSEHTEAIDQRLRDQGRMMIAAWGVLMASMVALWFR